MSAAGMHATPVAARPYLLIDVGDALYCLEMQRARAVVEVRDVTAVPGAPPALAGVTNIGGRVLAVADLRRLLGAGGGREAPGATAVVLDPTDADGEPLALLAAVVDAVELGEERIGPPPAFGLGARAGLVTGVAQLGDGRLALVLDAASLLAALAAPGTVA